MYFSVKRYKIIDLTIQCVKIDKMTNNYNM